MNTYDFDYIVASEIENTYMDRFHLNYGYMPVIRIKYGVPEDMATRYDDA